MTASLVQPEMEITPDTGADVGYQPGARTACWTPSWVTGAEAGRGLVESEYLFNFVPSAGHRPGAPGPGKPAPSSCTTRSRSNPNTSRWPARNVEPITSRVSKSPGAGHDSGGRGRPRLRCHPVPAAQREPASGCRRPSIHLPRHVSPDSRRFPASGSSSRTTRGAEYTVFEDELSAFHGSEPSLSRPWLIHTPPQSVEGDHLRAWLTDGAQLVSLTGAAWCPLGKPDPGGGVRQSGMSAWCSGLFRGSASDESGAMGPPVQQEEVAIRRGARSLVSRQRPRGTQAATCSR